MIWDKGSLAPFLVLFLGATHCHALLYLHLDYEKAFDISKATVQEAVGGVLTAKIMGVARKPECQLKAMISTHGSLPVTPETFLDNVFEEPIIVEGTGKLEVNITAPFKKPEECGSFGIAVGLICESQFIQESVPFTVPCEEKIDLGFEYPATAPKINAVQGGSIESDYVLKLKNNGETPVAKRDLLSAITISAVIIESGWVGSLEMMDQNRTAKDISDEILTNWMYSFKENTAEAIKSFKYVAGLELKMVDMTTETGKVVDPGGVIEIPLKDLTVEDKSGYPGLAALVIAVGHDESFEDQNMSDNAIAFIVNFIPKMSFDSNNDSKCSIYPVSSDAGKSAAISGKYSQTFLYDDAEGGFMPISNDKMIDIVMASMAAANTMMRLITTEQCTEESMKSIRGNSYTGFEMVRDNIENIRTDFEAITQDKGNATEAHNKIITMMTAVNEVLNAAVDDSNIKAKMFVSQILMFYMKKCLMGAKMMQDRRRRMGLGGGMGSGFGGMRPRPGGMGPGPDGMDFGGMGPGPDGMGFGGMGPGPDGMDFGGMGSRPDGMDFGSMGFGGMDFGGMGSRPDGVDSRPDGVDFGSMGFGGMGSRPDGMGSRPDGRNFSGMDFGDMDFGSMNFSGINFGGMEFDSGMDNDDLSYDVGFDNDESIGEILTGLLNAVRNRPQATTSPLTTGTDTVKIGANNRGGAPTPTKASPSPGWNADGRFFCNDMRPVRKPTRSVCDGFKDCLDGSDESDCPNNRRSSALRDEKISHKIKNDRKRPVRDEIDDFSMIESYSDAEVIYDQLTVSEKSELRLSAHRRHRKSFEDKILEFIEKYNVTSLEELLTAVNTSIELRANQTRSSGGRGRGRGGRGRGRGGRFRNRFAFLEDESAETSLENDSAETSLENDSTETSMEDNSNEDSDEDHGNRTSNVSESDRREMRRILSDLQRFLEENAGGSVKDEDDDDSVDDIMDVMTNIVQIRPRDLEEIARRRSERRRNRRRTAAMYSSSKRPSSMDSDGMKREIIDEIMERAKRSRSQGSGSRMPPPKPRSVLEEEMKMEEMINGIERTLYTAEPENMEQLSFLPLSLRKALKNAVLTRHQKPPLQLINYWVRAITSNNTAASRAFKAGMMQFISDIMTDVAAGRMPFNQTRLEDILNFGINNISVHAKELYVTAGNIEGADFIDLGTSYMKALRKNSKSIILLLGTAFMSKMMPDKMIKDISGDPSEEPELWEQCLGLGMTRLAYMEREMDDMEEKDSTIYQKPYDVVNTRKSYKMRKGFRPAYWSEENGAVMQGRYSLWSGLFMKTKLAVCDCRDMYGPPPHPWGNEMDGGMYSSGESYDRDWSGSRESYDRDWSGSGEMGGEDYDFTYRDYGNYDDERGGQMGSTGGGRGGPMGGTGGGRGGPMGSTGGGRGDSTGSTGGGRGSANFPSMENFGGGRGGPMESSDGGRGNSMGSTGGGRGGPMEGTGGGRGNPMEGTGGERSGPMEGTGGGRGGPMEGTGGGRGGPMEGTGGGRGGPMEGTGGGRGSNVGTDIQFPGNQGSSNSGGLTEAQKAEMEETAKKLQTALMDAIGNGGNINDVLKQFPNVNLQALMNPKVMSMISEQNTHKLPAGDEVTLLNKRERTLLDGSLIISGAVSVFNDGKRSAICDEVWGLKEAEVICKNIMYKYPTIQKKNLQFGKAKAQYTNMKTDKPETNDLLPEILLSNVRCNSNAASSILDCSHVNDSDSCKSGGHAGVTCHFMPAKRNA